jgi:hypothetical protein
MEIKCFFGVKKMEKYSFCGGRRTIYGGKNLFVVEKMKKVAIV